MTKCYDAWYVTPDIPLLDKTYRSMTIAAEPATQNQKVIFYVIRVDGLIVRVGDAESTPLALDLQNGSVPFMNGKCGNNVLVLELRLERMLDIQTVERLYIIMC